MLKKCYAEDIKRISQELEQFNNSFKLAVLADTHLDNSVGQTAANIRAVNVNSEFDCVVHLGDFLNGNLPRYYTKKLLKGQMDMFRKCTGDKSFFPVQGNHDGYADLTKTDSYNMAIDEDWYEATDFVDKYQHVMRKRNKPYFYADYPKEKIRLVILCTFYYTGFYGGQDYNKVYGTDMEQIQWLEGAALQIEAGWSVILFSHDVPFERFDENACIDNPRVNGNLLMDTVKKAQKENGFDLPAWFAGHFHGDYIGKVNDINFIMVASETAYVPQLWPMPMGGYYPPRSLNSKTEDLWDAVVLDKAARKVRLFRFGAGEDRELDY